MPDFASLGLRIDTTEAAKAVGDLNALSGAAKKTEKAVDDLGEASKQAGKKTAEGTEGVKKQTQAVKDFADAHVAAYRKTVAQQDGFLQSLRDQTAQYGKSRTEILAFQAAQLGLSDKAAPLIAQLKAQTEATKTLGAGQKLTANQSQQLGFQLNDLFVQVASGQSPLTALIQQGSQLNGTFGGFTGTLRAVASVFTVARVAIGGVLGVVGGLALAFEKGAEQSRALQTALLLTGNAAGVTEGQFNSLARNVADATKTTIGSSRDSLQALVASGRFTGEALESAAKATQGLSKVTGQSTDDIAASFVKAANGVAAFATETNKQYNYLSAAQLAYIKTLEDQGRVQEALAVTFNALNARISVATGNLGSLERGWGAVKRAASDAIDTMLSIGRAPIAESAVSLAERSLAAFDRRKVGLSSEQTKAGRQVLLEQLDIAKSSVREGQKQAQLSADRAQKEQAISAYTAARAPLLDKESKRLKEISDITAKNKAGGGTAKQLQEDIAAINEKYKGSTAGASAARLDAKAILAQRIEDVKAAGQDELNTLSNQSAVLEAQRAANLLRDDDYYGKKTKIVQDTTKARIDTLQRENALLSAANVSGRFDTERDTQIKKNQKEINTLQAQGATQTTVLGIQSQAAAKKISDGYDEARASAQAYLDVQQKSYDRDVASQGLSQRAQQKAAALAQIEDKYAQQRQQLESERRRGQLSTDQYNTELAIINQFQKRATESYEAYYDRITAAQGNWLNGANRAYANYMQTASDVASQTEVVFGNAFSGLEDALTTFVTTGKLSFSSLAKSIIADLGRVAAKAAVSQIFGASSAGGLGLFSKLAEAANPEGGFTSLLSGLFGGARDIGGPVSAGRFYDVNERGTPELLNIGGKQLLMMGDQSGSVEPLTQNSRAVAASSTMPGIQIVNQTQGRIDRVETQRLDDGQIALVVSQVRDAVNSGIRDPNGRERNSMQRSFLLQPAN